MISPVVTLIRDAFGLGPALSGLVITTHSLLIAVFAPLVGSLIDRVGTRRVMLTGLVAYAVFGAAGALAPTYPLLLASRAAFGVAAAGVINGLFVSLQNLWQGRARDTVMGYQATAASVGGVAWPLVGGVLGGLVGWQGPFAVYLIALPVAAVAVWLLPDSRSGDGTASADPSSGGDSASSPPAGTLLMRNLVRETPVLPWLYGLGFVIQVLLYSIVTYLPQRLDELGVTHPLLISVFIAAINVAAGLVGLVYGRLRGHLRYRSIFLAGFVLPVTAFAVLSLATRPWILLLGPLLFGPALALVLSATPARIGDAVPEHARGRATSYMSSLLMLGQFASPLLLGPVAGLFGIRAVFLTAAAISALATVAIAAAFHPDRAATTWLTRRR